MLRKQFNTTLNKELYKEIKVLAANENKNINDLLEEGMKLVIQSRTCFSTHKAI